MHVSSNTLSKPRLLRSRAALALPLAVAALILGACVPPDPGTPTTSSTSTSSTSTSSTTSTTLPLGAPTVTGQACQPGSGVTVVVDFTRLDNSVKIGCAPGAQANGLAALAAVGFAVGSQSGAGTVCTIDNRPTEGYPYCWLTGGYWGYWKAPNRTTPWDFSLVGAGDGPIAQGAVEGWSWAPNFDGVAPRVSVADLAAHTPALPVCAVPDAPVLSIIDDEEVLPFTIAGGGPIEVAAIAAGADPSTAVYTQTSSLPLAGLSGPTRFLARSASAGCQVVDRFDAVMDVRSEYAPRVITSGVQNPLSPAVSKDSSSILGWATGFSNYTPGADVSATYQVPSNAFGPPDSSPTVLGNGGHATYTFAAPIANGAGYDLAVYENPFTSGANDFLEFAYVEVSSNGVDFVRFDSANRWPTPVAAFGTMSTASVGGLAGKDLTNWGTPFDLETLKNKAAVRNGTVDLSKITHVRIVDIVGANDYPNVGDRYLDSWGRQIFDAHKTTGSGGFDLMGIGVLHQAAGA